jgi:hypothetical protein
LIGDVLYGAFASVWQPLDQVRSTPITGPIRCQAKASGDAVDGDRTPRPREKNLVLHTWRKKPHHRLQWPRGSAPVGAALPSARAECAGTAPNRGHPVTLRHERLAVEPTTFDAHIGR